MKFPQIHCYVRADSRFAPSKWETALLCNDVSHWLGTSLESVLLCDSAQIGKFAQDNIDYTHVMVKYNAFYNIFWTTLH